MGGKNKYMINGHNVQASQVQNLFHSVQLNVNNPHFLIMQGRITKVLNMKPPEILGMIAEAAGTRMFENKKQAALKTIEKKQTKVDEINSILSEEITPCLEKLRVEKAEYQQWASNNEKIEKGERFCVAFQFFKHSEQVAKSQDELKELEDGVKECQEKAKQAQVFLEEKETEIAELKENKDKMLEGQLRKCKGKEDSLSKDLVKANTMLKNKKALFETESKEAGSIGKQSEEAEASIAAKSESLKSVKAKVQEAKKVVEKKEEEHGKLKAKLQALTAGLASEEGTATLTEELARLSQEAQSKRGDVEKGKENKSNSSINIHLR